MEVEKRRLIDEVLEDEPIKNSFRIAWEFVVLNKNLTFTAMSMLLFLNIASLFLGFLATVLAGVMSVAIQIYVGRLFYESENINTFVEKTKKAKFETILSSNIFTALGAYLGTITLLFGTIFLMAFTVQSMGINLETLQLEELLEIISKLIIPIGVVALLVSYLHPLVQSNIALSTTFKEAYRAVFTIFSPSLWSRAFQGAYFKYVSLFILIIASILFLLSLLLVLPGINLLANFIVIVVMYLYMIVVAVASMVARRVTEG